MLPNTREAANCGGLHKLSIACVISARSASVSHLSAISMKKDLCSEVRAASANRMHSAALLRNWAKLGKCASISVHMGTVRALCPKNDSRSQARKRPHERGSRPKSFQRLSVMRHCPLCLAQPVPGHRAPMNKTEYRWSKFSRIMDVSKKLEASQLFLPLHNSIFCLAL